MIHSQKYVNIKRAREFQTRVARGTRARQISGAHSAPRFFVKGAPGAPLDFGAPLFKGAPRRDALLEVSWFMVQKCSTLQKNEQDDSGWVFGTEMLTFWGESARFLKKTC